MIGARQHGAIHYYERCFCSFTFSKYMWKGISFHSSEKLWVFSRDDVPLCVYTEKAVMTPPTMGAPFVLIAQGFTSGTYISIQTSLQIISVQLVRRAMCWQTCAVDPSKQITEDLCEKRERKIGRGSLNRHLCCIGYLFFFCSGHSLKEEYKENLRRQEFSSSAGYLIQQFVAYLFHMMFTWTDKEKKKSRKV